MTRHNNFDLIRLLAAVSVIFSHSFLLAEGRQDREPLWLLSSGQAVLGVAGVFVFFVISGYLVTQSWDATRAGGRFAAKRALRILPGLYACILVCTFVVGPLATVLPLRRYLADAQLHGFVLGNLVMDVERNRLPGVAFSGFDVGGIVDGPLWSLPCEALMYLLVLGLGLAGRLRLGVAVALVAAGMVAIWVDTSASGLLGSELLGSAAWLLAFFAFGMVAAKLGPRFPLDGRLAALAALGLIVALELNLFIFLFPLLGGYLTLWLALSPSLPVVPAARWGDLSYGLYIYGWPIEQLVVWIGGGALQWWEVFAVALPATAATAFLSWHIVERPALAFKPAPLRLAPASGD